MAPPLPPRAATSPPSLHAAGRAAAAWALGRLLPYRACASALYRPLPRGLTTARAASTSGPPPPPSPNDADDLARRAAAALQDADRAYHGAGGVVEESPLTDDAYDALKRAAVAAGVVPADRVGHPVDSPSKLTHPAPMLSLDSVSCRADADAWAARTAARLARAGVADDGGWTAEPKLDGLALRLAYRGGVLVQAATRGDGVAGDDVTASVLGRVDGAPRELVGAPADVEVRGEAYMTHAAFAAANEAAEAASLPRFSNPRNLAAATLRAGVGTATRSAAADAADRRRLSFAAYGVTLPPGTPEAPTTHMDCIAWLRQAGFGVADPVLHAPTLAGALDAAARWMDARADLPYDADGAVIKANSLAVQGALGAGPSAPRWAVAWKFPPVDAVTTLTGVAWQLGRTGALVPVAELAPVAVGGVTVARASLHNVQVARRLGARVGDAVVVRRAGDVVPQVVGPILKMRTGSETEWSTPTACPACGGPLMGGSDVEGDVLRCASRGCPGRSLKRVQHFASCVASDGVGPSTVAAIVDAGLAADAADLVALDAAALATLPRFGELRAAAVARALAAAFTAPPAAVLAGLAIPGVGPAVAEALLASFGSVRALADAAARGGLDVDSVRGVGPALAAELERWFAVDDNVALVDRLLAAGVGDGQVEREDDDAARDNDDDARPLAGLSFVVTGTVPSLSRSAAHAAIKAAGGTAASSVSARTAAVVVGDSPGKAKLVAAAEAGVRVVPAALFFGGGGRVVWRPAGEEELLQQRFRHDGLLSAGARDESIA